MYRRTSCTNLQDKHAPAMYSPTSPFLCATWPIYRLYFEKQIALPNRPPPAHESGSAPGLYTEFIAPSFMITCKNEHLLISKLTGSSTIFLKITCFIIRISKILYIKTFPFNHLLTASSQHVLFDHILIFIANMLKVVNNHNMRRNI